MSPTSLADLDGLPIWVAWRTEAGRKLPINPTTGRYAETDDPKTWGMRSAAAARCGKDCVGIGINLTEVSDRLALCGIDLDTCLDDGGFTPWAQNIIDRFGTYTEVSPSGVGAKIFFFLPIEERDALVAELRAETGDPKTAGRKWVVNGGNGVNHPAAVELYLAGRYFTVTKQVVGPALLRVVSADAVRWLIREAGPALVGDGQRPRDVSRSGAAFRAGMAARRAGKSFDEMVAALRANPETSAWVREKGEARGGRELRRIWEESGRRLSGPPYPVDAGDPYAIAKLFLDAHHDAGGLPTLYCHRDDFFAWTGASYLEQPENEVRAALYRFLDDECVVRSQDEDGNWQQRSAKPNPRLVSAILDGLRAAAMLPATIEPPQWIDERHGRKPEDIVACANGLLHLPTMELLPHTPAFFTHNALDIEYDADAADPAAWLEFLDQLWTGDPESVEALQDVFGYFLGIDTDQQKAFMLVGPPRSGKGTIARILTRMVGSENTVAPTLTSLGTNFGLQPLIGKRVAIISDARLSGHTDQAIIAERILSITGEDSITIDRKYRDAWTGRLKTRFLVLTNELPRLADASGAVASRFIMLMLTESFYGREDLGLANRLLAELPGILNWAIAGWQRLRRRGHFVQPASAGEAVQELEDLGSPTGAFLRERCVTGEGDVTANDLFDAWEQWCSDQKRQYPGDKATFGRNLRAALPSITLRRRRVNNGLVERYYPGIRLKTASELGTMSPEDERALMKEFREEEVPF